MTRIEHLLTILAEECMEVAKRASKALRFGLNEVQPGQDRTNARRIADELADLTAVVQMINDETALMGGGYIPHASWEDIIAKKQKVERFLGYSRECGTLKDD